MYEIHLTIGRLTHNEIKEFIWYCETIHVKPIIIELNKGETMQQPMISKKIAGVRPLYVAKKIASLKESLEKKGYKVIREKVEVPLNFIEESANAFPDFKGCYFEWHGKIKIDNIQELYQLIDRRKLNIHISKNSLKGENGFRFVTFRDTDGMYWFEYDVERIKNILIESGFPLVKEESEYCIYDTNKKIDKGWLDTPEITNHCYLHIMLCEAFLRRAAQSDDKFILKGSLLTRQYLKTKHLRSVEDVDFLYYNNIENKENASTLFSKWVTKVTETAMDDDIVFQSFKENDFWRGIDYAMNDDFPTVNTDLDCKWEGNGSEHEISLDISWNLDFEEEPIPLLYTPIVGSAFVVPYTVPLCLQLSWKLHQSIVRVRVKDLIDIVMLLEDRVITEDVLKKIVFYYIKECARDNIPPERLFHFIDGEVSQYYDFKKEEINSNSYFETDFGFFINPHDFSNQVIKNNVFERVSSVEELIRLFENTLKRSRIGVFLENELRDYYRL